MFGGVAQDGNKAGTGSCGQGQGEGGPTGADAMGGERLVLGVGGSVLGLFVSADQIHSAELLPSLFLQCYAFVPVWFRHSQRHGIVCYSAPNKKESTSNFT